MSEDWQSLIVPLTKSEIAPAIQDGAWQALRLRLHYTPLEARYVELVDFLADAKADELRRRQVCVANYVNALKRGGLIK